MTPGTICQAEPVCLSQGQVMNKDLQEGRTRTVLTRFTRTGITWPLLKTSLQTRLQEANPNFQCEAMFEVMISVSEIIFTTFECFNHHVYFTNHVVVLDQTSQMLNYSEN